jgi:adenylate cyclase
MIDALRHFKAGLVKYRQQKWDDAAAEFKEVLALNDKDKAAKLYIERCDYLKKNPPTAAGETWDGVWVLESK